MIPVQWNIIIGRPYSTRIVVAVVNDQLSICTACEFANDTGEFRLQSSDAWYQH